MKRTVLFAAVFIFCNADAVVTTIGDKNYLVSVQGTNNSGSGVEQMVAATKEAVEFCKSRSGHFQLIKSNRLEPTSEQPPSARLEFSCISDAQLINIQYVKKVIGTIKKNVDYVPPNNQPLENATLEIKINLLPDGSSNGDPQVIKTSGNTNFDEAVKRGISHSFPFPADEYGHVPASLTIRYSLF
ncbi:TonB C-terminal domain-containing protein [Solimicrobium silvestre]|uniref:TonB C terminal n=1 Tax=Solimicrobium silvestre TaxID=2099400 RepID=A0A2S9GS92_9BURK|nr:TonB C-terminal domain-containing protein [Solimicrobium silvestre]PRC90565.1 TonB C terminal [Solimicrobium silvestre]